MHMSIGQRILSGFALVIVFTAGLGMYQLANLGTVRDVAQRVIDADFESMRLLRQAVVHRTQMSVYRERMTSLYFMNKNGFGRGDPGVAAQQWELARQRVLEILDELSSHAEREMEAAASPGRAEAYRRLLENTAAKIDATADVTTVVRKQVELLSTDRVADVVTQIDVLDKLRDNFSDLQDESESIALQLAAESIGRIDSLYDRVKALSMSAIGVVVLAALALAWSIHRSISRPLTDFMSFVERVGRGDLTQKTANVSRDELGKLGAMLNGMVDGLAEVAQQSRAATGQLNSAAAELQASAKQQASSTSEQSAAIQQVTSTLSEIAQSGLQISARAKEVAAAAESTSQTGKNGIEAATETTRSINGISEQAEAVASNIVALTETAQSIGEIIANVNDIAERSDLLALNAAIEAAAAGEHGQSFSVVAEEMKNLANQAKEATKQVGQLLGDIQKRVGTSVMQTEEAVKRVESGRVQVEKTEETIRNLVASVEESIATFQQIVAATNQQQIGIGQVTQSVQNIRQASEQMTLGIRDLEQSSVNFTALSAQLKQSVERYVV